MRILSVLLLALPLSALGQDVPYLVRDLPGLTIHDSMQYGQTCFWANTGNITWFTAMTASGGREIFKTDGTSGGTVQVTHGTGVPEGKYNGPFLGLVNGKLIYGGVDADGHGLFALDSNGGDPVLLARMQIAYLTNGVVRGGTLYFSGRPDTSTEQELWATNGTPETTVRFELLPGEQGAFNGSKDTRLFSAGPWMYFYGTTWQGTGLHRTDGTPDNTLLVLPLSTTIVASWTGVVASVGNRLIVYFTNPPTQTQLWSTDGTTAGTTQISSNSIFRPIGVLDGKLYFDARGVWTTDGTAAGTHLADIVSGTNAAVLGMANTYSEPGHVAGGRLFFIRSGWLFVTDGTAAGTHTNFLAGQDIYTTSGGFTVGNFYYFPHDDGVHGMELWRTDGTIAEMVADINPGSRNGINDSVGFERPDGTALFAATNYDSGREPWITDGTAAGTHLLANIAADDPLNGSSPAQLRASGSKLFFTAHLTGGQALGTSDGTSAGTSATLVDPRWFIGAMGTANGLYFFGNLFDGLYASDGTLAGTTKIFERSVSGKPLANGVAFADGNGLWFSDGTAAGTRKLQSFDSAIFNIYSDGAIAWITKGAELWRTDGSEAGTVRVPLDPAPTTEIANVTRSGSSIYFTEWATGNHGSRLWRSDGSGPGATVLHDFGNNQATIVGATDHMIYVSVAGKLYRSDGTPDGTIALPSDVPCFGATMTAALGDAFFYMSMTGYSATLWRTDGTSGGTTALQVMFPPNTDSFRCAGTLVSRGNNVYYSGWDADHGWELWQTDGTAAGTHLTADIYPGRQGSYPQELTVAGSRLFFSADSPNIGRELWALGPPPIARRRAVRP